MIGFHFQGNSDNWPQAVALLPKGAPVKVIDGVQRCAEAKAANPGVYTVVRHHVGEQNPAGDQIAKARAFFASFVDGSFRQIARHVDAVQEWNEYFANGMPEAERQLWIDWATACVIVWRDEYRTQSDFAHIDLIIAETAVGNDIPADLAQLSHVYDWVVLGYHAYVPVWRGEVRPDDWRWYSGRWEQMDNLYRSMGFTRVKWFFGEFGAVGHNGPGWPNSLAPNDGWIDDDVYNGNIAAYIDMMRYWIQKAAQTNAYKTGRIRGGATIFTSGGGSQWRKFEVKQPEMNVIALAVRDFVNALPDVPVDPDPPDPPVEPDCKGEPREQYHRRYRVAHSGASREEWLALADDAYDLKQTVGFSYDDAGIGALNEKEAILYGLEDDEHTVFTQWFSTYYPGTVVKFDEYPPDFTYTNQIINVTDRLPKHPTKKYSTRNIEDITTIVVHHTVSNTSAWTIAQYHVTDAEHQWPGFAYHFLIESDGTIKQCQYLTTVSYHARQANPYSLGIALSGNFNYEQPTEYQLTALYWLINELRSHYENIQHVLGHKEVPSNSTECPGNTWDSWRIE